MPKRVIDGEAMWASDKIAACDADVPASTGVYYSWFYSLADVNGSFECTSTRVIHGKIAAQLPFLRIEHTEKILHDFHRNGLLFVWSQDGKRYAHWTKSEEKNSVPKSLRERYRPTAPPVPQKEYEQYLQNFNAVSPVFLQVSVESRMNQDVVLSESRASQEEVLTASRPPQTKLLLGLGIGLGIGASDENHHSRPNQPQNQPLTQTLVRQKTPDASVRKSDFETLWDAYPRKEQKPPAREVFHRLNVNGHFPELLSGLEVWKRSEQWQTPRFIPLLKTWLANRGWEDRPARIAHAGDIPAVEDIAAPVPLTREMLGTPPAGFEWEELQGHSGGVAQKLLTGECVCKKCGRSVVRSSAAIKHHKCPKGKA